MRQPQTTATDSKHMCTARTDGQQLAIIDTDFPHTRFSHEKRTDWANIDFIYIDVEGKFPRRSPSENYIYSTAASLFSLRLVSGEEERLK